VRRRPDLADDARAALGTREPEAEFTQRVKFELRFQGAKIHESYCYPTSEYNSGYGVEDRSCNWTKHVFRRLLIRPT
jgi:hypothetical protein